MKRIAALLLATCVAGAAGAQTPVCLVNGVRLGTYPTASTDSRLFVRAEIDPNTIENIEVVKGAAAARTYGPDGANGVISVTLKKGASTKPWEKFCGQFDTSVPDPFGKYLYSPELVTAHQSEIGLTNAQRLSIFRLTTEALAKSVDPRMKLELETERLTKLLAVVAPDESTVLAQIDVVLALEREIKRAQLTLLVRVKNQLTLDQQAQLDKLK